MILEGVLYNASGPLKNIRIMFEAIETTLNGVAKGAKYEFITNSEGEYSLEMKAGYFEVSYVQYRQKYILGVMTSAGDVTVSLPAVLHAQDTPVDPDATLDMIQQALAKMRADLVDSQEARDRAKLAETNSKNSAAEASTSASQATNRAAEALVSENNAKDSEQAAASSELNAAASESAAAVSETNADASEASAEKWAENPYNQEVVTGQYSALHHATMADSHKAAALQSAVDASNARLGAETAETNAKASESAATASESASLASENAAATSEAKALASEQAASASESAALASEQASAASEAAASTSEANAFASETNAEASADLAKDWAISTSLVDGTYYGARKYAIDAEASEIATQASETAANGSASAAASSASSALASEQAAASSESAAASSESAAANSETNAAASESIAAQSASAASSSEDNAASSASAAQTARTGAEDAESGAVTAKAGAETARDQAEQIFAQFGDQYLGPFASDPTTDNSGNPLTIGDIYFDTSNNVLKFYSGTAWVSPESIASNAASQAQASASAAATSESNAASSESAAAASASQASTSASNASASETAAAASAGQAVADHEESNDPHDQYVRKDTEALKKTATLDLDFSSGDYALDDGEKVRTTNAGEVLTVERATPKWVFGPNGKLREVPPNTIARQWNPATGKPEGVLIEESRTNLALWSEDFTNEVWTKTSDSRVEPNVIAAPGHDLADKYVVGSGTDNFRLQQTLGVDDNDTVVGSIYVKAGEFTQVRVRVGRYSGEQSVDVSLIDGTILAAGDSVLSYEVEPVGNGWFRIGVHADLSISTGTQYFTIDPLAGGNESVEGDGTSGIYIWGAQLEEGSSPSSYIPTEDAQVTRADDSVSRTLGDEFNPSEGTLYLDKGETSESDKFSIAIGFSSGAYLGLDYSTSKIAYFNPFVGAIKGSNSAWDEPHKFAASWQVLGPDSVRLIIARDGEIFINEVYSGDTSSIAGWDKLSINDRLGNFIRSGEYKDAALFPHALSETELIDLTS